MHRNVFTNVGWFLKFSYEEPLVLIFKKEEFGSNFGLKTHGNLGFSS